MTRALLLVDIQNDYFTGGNMELVGMEAAAANAQTLLAAARERAQAVWHIQHLSVRPGATFFVPATQGVEIHQSVAPGESERQIRKHYPNAFRDTSLHEELSQAGIETVTICGAMSHMCIDATTRAAFDLGYGCTVVQDACATRALAFDGRTLPAADVHAAFMAALAVPYANIVNTAEAVAAA